MKRFWIGLLIGLVIFPIAVFLYFHYGNLPVAVADKPFFLEKNIVRAPLHARIAKDMPKSVPVQTTPANLIAGAEIYRQNCAFCHGSTGQNSTVAPHMYPDAPQLWQAHGPRSIVGVSDDPPAETYWKVSNGIRLSGMPSFKQVLSSMQMWQVSLLLANADKPLPQPAIDILSMPLTFASQPPVPQLNDGLPNSQAPTNPQPLLPGGSPSNGQPLTVPPTATQPPASTQQTPRPQ